MLLYKNTDHDNDFRQGVFTHIAFDNHPQHSVDPISPKEHLCDTSASLSTHLHSEKQQQGWNQQRVREHLLEEMKQICQCLL